jgi:hypothetical protein
MLILTVFNQALVSKLLELEKKQDRLLKEFAMLMKKMFAFLQAQELPRPLIFWFKNLELKKFQIKLKWLKSKIYPIKWVRFRLMNILNNWIFASKIAGIHMIASFAR